MPKSDEADPAVTKSTIRSADILPFRPRPAPEAVIAPQATAAQAIAPQPTSAQSIAGQAIAPQAIAAKAIAGQAPGPALTPEVRLARALESLQQALVQNRAATARWRTVLGELKTTVQGLHDSLLRYQTNLKTLNSSVTNLKDKAHALEDWADGASGTQH